MAKRLLRYPVLTVRIKNQSKKEVEIVNDLKPKHDLLFTFDLTENTGTTPPDSTATFYNAGPYVRGFLKPKNIIYFYISYEGLPKQLIQSGTIKEVDPRQYDGTTSTIPITLSAGKDYNSISAKKIQTSKTKKVGHYKRVKTKVNGKWVKRRVHYYSDEKGKKVGHYKEKKVYVKGRTKVTRQRYTKNKKVYSNLTFKKGVKPSTAIKKIAKESGIEISSMKLKENKAFKKGYTVSGKPMNAINKLVKTCHSKMYYDKGQLIISDMKKSKASHLILDYHSGLISEPTFSKDDGDSSDTWESTSILIPQISVRSTYEIHGEYVHKTLVCQSVTFSFDGTQPTMTVQGTVYKK